MGEPAKTLSGWSNVEIRARPSCHAWLVCLSTVSMVMTTKAVGKYFITWTHQNIRLSSERIWYVSMYNHPNSICKTYVTSLIKYFLYICLILDNIYICLKHEQIQYLYIYGHAKLFLLTLAIDKAYLVIPRIFYSPTIELLFYWEVHQFVEY